MGELRLASRAYLLLLLAVALGLAGAGATVNDVSVSDLIIAVVLACAAAIAQLLRAAAGSKQAFALSPVFIVAGVFLLPPALLAPVVAITFIPEWVRYRRSAVVTLFNMVNVVLDSFAAYIVASLLGLHRTESILTVTGALASFAAVVTFIGLNRLLIAGMLRVARGCSWQQTGLLDFDTFLTDLSVASVGILIAALWSVQPALSALVALPLYLLARALEGPALSELAQSDRKTGLYNARHFESALAAELSRARRFGNPVSVAMIDLDLMRVINNGYGHVAGDAVIRRIAQIIRQGIREYDVAARFGGEEFALVLPGCGHKEAISVCERLRAEVAESEFVIPTSRTPIRATMSAGVASYPQDAADPASLVHFAVQAVYMAKARGRNRVGAWTVDDTETHQVATQPVEPVDAPDRVTSLDSDGWRNSGLPRFALNWATIKSPPA